MSTRKIPSALSLQDLRKLATCHRLHYLDVINTIRNLLNNLNNIFCSPCELLPFCPHAISVVYAWVCKSNHFVYGLTPYEAADHKYISDLNRQAVFAKVSLISSIFEILCEELPRINKTVKDSGRIKGIINWTNDNFHKKITLKEVSEIFGVSKFHFCKLFKRFSGTTYIDYLNQVRLDHAKELLKHCTPILETCYDSGFEDLSYFTCLFKKYENITPGQFRKRYC